LTVGISEIRRASRPISRVLSTAATAAGSHSSRVLVTKYLMRPTRIQRGPRQWIPIWPCSRWGLPCHACYHARGALLPHPFTLTGSSKRTGGLLSVALSVGSNPPGVTWHPALRSPDFPPAERLSRKTILQPATTWPTRRTDYTLATASRAYPVTFRSYSRRHPFAQARRAVDAVCREARHQCARPVPAAAPRRVSAWFFERTNCLPPIGYPPEPR